jgi:hypothetical protein
MDNDYFLPLLVFGVQQPQLAGFIEHLEHSQTIADGDSFYSLYGVRRTNPEIGEYYVGLLKNTATNSLVI